MITSRRTFLKTTALSGASLLIGIDGNRLLHGAHTRAAGPFKPNVWIRIDPDGSVTLTIGRSEMGQGVRTSLTMLLAEELEADWTRIKLVQASPGPGFEDIGTGGSDSIRDGWKSLRQAGATAREMLAMAAAARWKVDRTTCTAASGFIIHTPSGRRFSYGDLVADAARLPLPEHPPLKNASDYKIIGQRTARIDGRDIVSGKARYGIDVKVPGMAPRISRAPTVRRCETETHAGRESARGSWRPRHRKNFERDRGGCVHNMGSDQRPHGAGRRVG